MSRRDKRKTVWFFDLDNTLHDASHASFGPTSAAMTDYMVAHLQVDADEAAVLRNHYWHRYGATLLGLVRHHGVHGQHFLETTHRLPGLEDRLRTSAHDRAALQRLPGRKVLLTNAPRSYALRVMRTLGLLGCFDAVLCVEDMRMFGHWRPKPDVRMFRHVCARLKVRPAQCVLVEDTLEHQHAAHSLGMRTVWMQRYLRSAAQAAAARPDAPRRCIKPPYVCARIHRVHTLLAPW